MEFDGDGLSDDKQYIFGVHPHGIHCWPLVREREGNASGVCASFHTQCASLPPQNVFAFHTSPFYKRLPNAKLTGVAATIMFKIPVVRELFLLMGYVDAGRPTCQKVLAQGSSLYICTGGEAESLETRNGVDAVVLEGRKGFVRLALSYGTPLVPVYGLGNNEIYRSLQPFPKLRRWLSKNFHVAM